MILLDTNILIHSNQDASPHFNSITNKLIAFAESKEELVVCPQVIYEFYAVATRPVEARGGLGMCGEDTLAQIKKFQSNYLLINDPSDLFSIWLGLIQQYVPLGTSAHDARLVAFMKGNSFDRLYTMNPKHFNRYANIITILN